MHKIQCAVFTAGDGTCWINFGEFAEIQQRKCGVSPQETWRGLRDAWRSRGGLTFTTAGMIEYNAEEQTPESLSTTFDHIFVPRGCVNDYLGIL